MWKFKPVFVTFACFEKKKRLWMAPECGAEYLVRRQKAKSCQERVILFDGEQKRFCFIFFLNSQSSYSKLESFEKRQKIQRVTRHVPWQTRRDEEWDQGLENIFFSVRKESWIFPEKYFAGSMWAESCKKTLRFELFMSGTNLKRMLRRTRKCSFEWRLAKGTVTKLRNAWFAREKVRWKGVSAVCCSDYNK